ncbi:VOC family protein [Pseudomonas putida]|uniref:VOC family protein n=1 Tax=Pseudomonas putida TaxID=303 RepID=UPI002363C7DE|nr:VOC family protein [Pseudomonas putida]MDD1964137.1 VOC family protein [Pseudomonas putida]
MKFIAAVFMLLSVSFTAWAQVPGIKTAGIDHVGINVPDLAQAEQFLATTFGCTPVTHIGPFDMTASLAADHKTPVAPRAKSLSISMVRCSTGSNIELFEYSHSTSSDQVPFAEDLGASHVAFYTDDVKAGVAYLKSKGITVLGEPMTMTAGDTEGETWVHFLSPWGSEMELVGYPHGKGYERTTKARLWNPKHPAN